MKRKIIPTVILSTLFLVSCTSVSANKLATIDTVKTDLYERYKTSIDNKLLTSYTSFGAKISTICSNYDDNSCVSPLSIYSALSMLTGITNGNTRKEILDYLEIDYDTLSTNYNKLYTLSNLYNSETNETIEVLNNSIWLQQDKSFKMDGINNVSNDFKTNLFSIDFNNKNTNKYINDYIKDKTNGLIDNEFNIPTDTVLSLINTLYLKDNWFYDSRDIQITDSKIEFKNINGTKKEDYFLKKYGNGKAYSNQYMTTFSATTSNGYSVKFILPKDNYNIKDIFTEYNIKEALNANYYDYDTEKYEYTTILEFPMFSAKSNINIKDYLIASGIKEAFSDSADFSIISTNPLICNDVFHVANIDVNRKGIKGAAATIITMGESANYDERIKITEELIIDKSFGYLITDRNGILFSGIINNI